MKEFKVNEYIKLKLEGKDTNIYINEKFFRQCKYLLLNIPITQISSFQDIKSIDEAAESLDHTLDPLIDEEGNMYRNDTIPPEVEFWGHCSNIQVWYEHDYDTRLLHRNLAFPLLKNLTEAGDPLAKEMFKNEIAKRIDSGNVTVIKYLIIERYIDFLEFEELEAFIDFPPILEAFNTLLEEEFSDRYVPALKKHGTTFQFLRKNEKAFPIAFSLQRLRDRASDILRKLLERIIPQMSYKCLLYLNMEGLFYIIDYQNFSDTLNSHIINELYKGIRSPLSIIFNLSFLMLVSLSYGTHEKRDGSLSHRFQLKDNLHLKKNLLPEQYSSFINDIAKRLVPYFEFEEYKFYIEAICDFFSSFGEYALEGLTYIFENSSGELQSISQKCLIQIKTANPDIEIEISPQTDITIDTVLKLNSKEIKTLIPFHTGKFLVEFLMLQFHDLPHDRIKWDYFDGLFYFFEKIGKEAEIQIGDGVMSLLARRDSELTDFLIELKLLEYLNVEEAVLLAQNLDYVRDFLKILEKQDNFEGKAEYMGKLSKYFEKLKGNIDKSLETKLITVFDEFSPTFQVNVIKLHFLTFPSIEDLFRLFQVRISGDDLFDYFFLKPFFKNLVSNMELVEDFLNFVMKSQDRQVFEGILETGFLTYIDTKELISLDSNILENIIPLIKKIFNFTEEEESEADEDYYYDDDFDGHYHEDIEYLEKKFNEVSEIKSITSLPIEEFDKNSELLGSLIEKKYLQFIKREQFWSLFPEEGKYLKQVEEFLENEKLFEFYPEYRIDSPTGVKGLGFSLKDNKIFFVSVTYSKLNNEEIEKVLEILSNTPSIERLELNHNRFTDLPNTISVFKNLKYLILTYAGLTYLPETIGDLTQLIHLAINYNKFTKLPDSIGNLVNLSSIYLNQNSELTCLPETFGKLENLTSLSLSGTAIKKLPETLGTLKALGSLRLEGSQVSELPGSIIIMPSLSFLYLSETPIEKLPDSIGNSKSLEFIDISRTQIKILPESIKNIESLEEIIVSNSYLKNLPALRKLITPLVNKEIKIRFKGSTTPSRFAYFTNKLEGDKPYSKSLY